MTKTYYSRLAGLSICLVLFASCSLLKRQNEIPPRDSLAWQVADSICQAYRSFQRSIVQDEPEQARQRIDSLLSVTTLHAVGSDNRNENAETWRKRIMQLQAKNRLFEVRSMTFLLYEQDRWFRYHYSKGKLSGSPTHHATNLGVRNDYPMVKIESVTFKRGNPGSSQEATESASASKGIANDFDGGS